MNPQKPTIAMEQLELLDVRLCRILEVTPILKNPKRDPGDDNPVKAYKLLIDTGLDQRECVTNLIGYRPEELLGRTTPFILNLPESEIRGVKSRAMIVAAKGEAKTSILLSEQVETDTARGLIGAVIF